MAKIVSKYVGVFEIQKAREFVSQVHAGDIIVSTLCVPITQNDELISANEEIVDVFKVTNKLFLRLLIEVPSRSDRRTSTVMPTWFSETTWASVIMALAIRTVTSPHDQ